MQVDGRIKWIDLMRCIAILGVVMCHAVEFIYSWDLNYMVNISWQSKFFAFSFFSFARLGVPFFLMISGYLLLDRKYDGENIKEFWKNKWLHLLICTEIWFFIYEIFLKIFNYSEEKLWQIGLDFVFMHNVDMKHIWYMPMILGIYILIPFVSNALKAVEERYIIFPVVFYLVFISGSSFVNIICNVFWGQPAILQLSDGYSGGIYGIYLVIGYMIKKGMLKKTRIWLLFTIFSMSIILGIIIQMWAYYNNYAYNIWYDSPFICCASVSMFEICSRISLSRFYSVLKLISKYSFAIYLIHMIILMPMADRINILSIGMPVKVIMLWILTLGVSFIAVWLICKIPKIGKFLFYMKSIAK